jgi:uncharacterized protein
LDQILSNSYLAALVGGALIGFAAALLLIFNGRIAGISGILSSSIFSPKEAGWRVYFLMGLIGGGITILITRPELLANSTNTSAPVLIVSGLLVGFGTRLGGGCTSGHGVCGTSRLSARSIISTITFLIVGMITATLMGKLGLS